MSLKTRLTKTAKRLTNKYGNDITLLKNVYGEPNLVNGIQPVTVGEVKVRAVFKKIPSLVDTNPIDGKYTVGYIKNINLFTTVRKSSGAEVKILSVVPIEVDNGVVAYEIFVSTDNTLRG